ncbi:MAG: glycerol-3-phosphate acyltransferase [Hominenteromicrobium sp.]
MLKRDIFYIAIGYLLGSILFARLGSLLFKRRDVTQEGSDRNPGTMNAFLYGGFWCGVFALCGDLLKGFLPVFLYQAGQPKPIPSLALALVMTAPVLGHICPVYAPMSGGKGIAVTFGCLLGLLPDPLPLAVLAGAFLFFSLIIRISPHFYRTLATYFISAVLMAFLIPNRYVVLGFLLIAVLVTVKLLLSTEEKERFEVKFAWKH